MQVLVTIGGHGQRQGIGQLHGGELLRRHQVFIEILELAGALHPHIARSQLVLQLRQSAQLVKAPIETRLRFEQPRPTRRDEFAGGVRRHLFGIAGVHCPQGLDGVQHIFGCGRGPQFENVQELRRVTPQGGIAIAHAVKEIKARGLGQHLRLADAFCEVFPWQHGFNGGKWVSAGFLGLNQRNADPAIQAHFVIDGLAGCLELLCMLVLGSIEQLADDAVMQADDFINDRGHAFNGKCHQGGIAPLWLELGQVKGPHLPTLAGDLEQSVLMHGLTDASGQVQGLPCPQSLDVFQHVARIGLFGRLPQPGQLGGLASFLLGE